jgi:NAD(P)H-dependent FMN reductase
METLILSGSTAAVSTSARLAGLIQHRLERLDPVGTVTALDRRLLRLPGLDADSFTTGALEADPDVGHIRERLAAAHAVVLITPVQHGSYAGALKNLLDHAPRAALRDKAVLVAATGATVHTGATACDHLRAVVRSMGGWSVPTQLVAERAELIMDPPERLIGRVDRAASQLLQMARLLSPAPAVA